MRPCIINAPCVHEFSLLYHYPSVDCGLLCKRPGQLSPQFVRSTIPTIYLGVPPPTRTPCVLLYFLSVTFARLCTLFPSLFGSPVLSLFAAQWCFPSTHLRQPLAIHHSVIPHGKMPYLQQWTLVAAPYCGTILVPPRLPVVTYKLVGWSLPSIAFFFGILASKACVVPTKHIAPPATAAI